MNAINWAQAILYADLVNVAESVDPGSDYTNADKAKIDALGYKYVRTIYGDELATDVDPHLGEVVTFGFLAISPDKELVVAIRGTATIWEWIHDFSFLMVPAAVPRAHGLTEDGFSAVYRSLRAEASNSGPCLTDAIRAYLHTEAATTVTVCGHSLGGALATLVALDVALNTPCRSPGAYTYASPRVGDHIFAGFFNAAVHRSYRIANRHDVVPNLPPVFPLPYDHVHTGYELNPPPDRIASTIACMHHLTTYLWLIGREANVKTCDLNPECVAGGGAQKGRP